MMRQLAAFALLLAAISISCGLQTSENSFSATAESVSMTETNTQIILNQTEDPHIVTISGYVTTDLNIRECGGMACDEIGRLAEGEFVTVACNADTGWCVFGRGFVCGRYIGGGNAEWKCE